MPGRRRSGVACPNASDAAILTATEPNHHTDALCRTGRKASTKIDALIQLAQR